MHDFIQAEYLKSGSVRQQQAYEELTRLGIFEHLSKYHPVLTGTIPLGLDLPESDLDIICERQDHREFATSITALYGTMKAYEIYSTKYNGIESTVARFSAPEFEIEIFGQNIPVKKQNAYQHLLIESRVLELYGNEFRSGIMKLKREGYKTEPAFAKLLGLEGDPYKALLELVI